MWHTKVDHKDGTFWYYAEMKHKCEKYELLCLLNVFQTTETCRLLLWIWFSEYEREQ